MTCCCCCFLCCYGDGIEGNVIGYSPIDKAHEDTSTCRHIMYTAITKQAFLQWKEYIDDQKINESLTSNSLWPNKGISVLTDHSNTELSNYLLYINPSRFPVLGELERKWQIIWEECKNLLESKDCYQRRFIDWVDEDMPSDNISEYLDPSFDHHELKFDTVTGKWKLFPFFAFGNKLDKNCALAPRTAGLLAKIPDLTIAGFSVLEPGAHIKPHLDYENTSHVRCHLGLSIPDNCGFCVSPYGKNPIGIVRRWKEGHILAFNGNKTHESWNFSSEKRIVLLLDFGGNTVPVKKMPAWMQKEISSLY